MPELNKDILFLIFEELHEDSKSLFSCLTVNRLWCENVIPILWRNPWNYIINYDDKISLYYIVMFYLPNDIKELLARQPPESISFDYLSFCKSIDVDILNIIISRGSSSSYNQFILQREIYGLIIRKCPELKYLNIRSIEHQVFYFPEAKSRLESLCELKCDTSIDSSYFYGLASICQNIHRIIITNEGVSVNHGIVKLIEVQKNLKYFEWEDNFGYEEYIGDPYDEIFLALTKNASSLNHLILLFQFIEGCEYQFLQETLPKLYKLKTLIITNVFIFINEYKLIYHELEVFNVDYISLSAASSIIENSRGNLREISLRYYNNYDYEVNFNEDSLVYIRKIYENCPLIEYLSLTFSSENFIEFDKLLKACQNLKSLLLLFIHNSDREETGNELLKILIRSAPTSLREIRFFNDFQFSLKNLEEFFEKWKGRPALSIQTAYLRDDYMELIDKYKSIGVVEDFKCVPMLDIYF
ncbi:uncharacterized protein OCT59_010127 [Rhizophagus irregularis]|uniref:F-box domain-containing protein n=2 Tax=Rhizophagus irregularis TaxID=588596 RepID=A0A015L949_RHIIW|nr:hypothetical protein RirG_035600 [Rhizophagus irregularis DAOM 197198w]UZO18818.1 hypothetical protein OCT59_010127 [Rhizophagus irregularis]GET54448.1 hypothetical protein GLOIN_2v1764020 [Rhizophagus irregularis DAOM 181602=DAOM 197198]